MNLHRNPIPVEDAINKVLACQIKGDIERIPLMDADNRILSEDLIADHDVPLFDRSPYDGYALIANDTIDASLHNPIVLDVVGAIGAGSVYTEPLQPSQAIRIMTGAKIPTNADCVIMLEDITEDSPSQIKLIKKMKKNQNISFQGEDVAKGTVIVKKGTKINPGIVALLATFGYKDVPVYKRPVIGVMATGSELIEVGEPLEEGKIRNSNAYMIISQIKRAGAIAKYYGQVSDVLEECVDQMKRALNEVDFLITTGGVSVGDYDLLPAIYQQMNAEVLFNKVAMRPGSVTTVATINEKILFGLSGNPSACYVGFELFAKPMIDTYLAKESIGLKIEKAILSESIDKKNSFDRFIRGKAYMEKGQLHVKLSGKDKSNMVHSLAEANCLIHLQRGRDDYRKGAVVDIRLIDELY